MDNPFGTDIIGWLKSILSPSEAQAEPVRQGVTENPWVKIVDRRPAATEKANFTGDYPTPVVKAIVQSSVRNGVDPYTALAVSLQENNLGKAQKGTSGISWGNWLMPDFNNERTLSLFEKSRDAGSVIDRLQLDTTKKISELTSDRHDMREEIQGETGNKNANYWDDPGYKRNENEAEFWRDTREKAMQYRNALPEVLDFDSHNFTENLKRKLDYSRTVLGSDIPEELAIQGYNGLGKIKGSDDRIIDTKKERPYGKRVIALREYAIKQNPFIQETVREAYKQK